MDSLSTGEIAMRVGGALLCGALVGLERERKHRPAGFRTMILISLGSCGFVLIGAECVANYAAATAVAPGVAMPGQAEMSRIIQGLMGGIGFLGAGAVIQNKKAVRGLTTAAAVWVVSALGAACGFGFYTLALILGGATLFTLVVLDMVEEKFFPEPDDWKTEKKNGNGNGIGSLHADPDCKSPSDAGYGAARMQGEEDDEQTLPAGRGRRL